MQTYFNLWEPPWVCQFADNYWKNLPSTQLSILLILEIFFQLLSEGSVLVAPVYMNSAQLFMKFAMILTAMHKRSFISFKLMSVFFVFLSYRFTEGSVRGAEFPLIRKKSNKEIIHFILDFFSFFVQYWRLMIQPYLMWCGSWYSPI